MKNKKIKNKIKPMKPATRTLIAHDRKYLWHPFTQMSAWIEKGPVIIIEKAKGCTLIDTDGNRYLDGVSSLWCNVHGHRVKKIDNAIRKQLARVAHTTLLGLGSPPSIKLAKMLIESAPKGLTRVFYSDDGATAVEAALKIALQYHIQTGHPEKRVFAGLYNAYHGDTIGAVSVGGMDSFHGIFAPLRFETIKIPSPYCYRCPENMEREKCSMECVKKAEEIIEKNQKKLAALIMEPLVQGAAGMIVHPEGYLKKIREICERNSVLFIADEVATGFGRTGALFACDVENITPDIMCLAKGITGGYLPLAATIATEKIFEAFLGSPESQRAFLHGHTYTGNALACSAAIESLKLLRKKVMPELPQKINLVSSLLEEKIKPLENVGDIRQKGLMIGIELVENKKTKSPFPPQALMGRKVTLRAIEKGVFLRPLSDIIVLMPPLTISMEEIEFLINATKEAIKETIHNEKENAGK